MDSPKTLQEAIEHFSDYDNCRRFMASIRWLDGIVRCPTCNSDKVIYLDKARVYKCNGNHPRQKFSLKIGTVFEDSTSIGNSPTVTLAMVRSGCEAREPVRPPFPRRWIHVH